MNDVPIPKHAEEKFAAAYAATPHFHNRIVEFIPLILMFLQFLQGCANREAVVIRKIRKGRRFARNYAIGVVRKAHPEIPADQQQVLAENLVDEWKSAPDGEIREMVELSKQVVVD